MWFWAINSLASKVNVCHRLFRQLSHKSRNWFLSAATAPWTNGPRPAYGAGSWTIVARSAWEPNVTWNRKPTSDMQVWWVQQVEEVSEAEVETLKLCLSSIEFQSSSNRISQWRHLPAHPTSPLHGQGLWQLRLAVCLDLDRGFGFVSDVALSVGFSYWFKGMLYLSLE